MCLCLKGDTDTTLFQVKMINYIRRCVHLNTCLQCGDIFPDQVTMIMMMMMMMMMMILPWQPSLLEHMTWSGHHVPGPSSDWDQPQYYFPTYENDNLLCGLEVCAVLSASLLCFVKVIKNMVL